MRGVGGDARGIARGRSTTGCQLNGPVRSATKALFSSHFESPIDGVRWMESETPSPSGEGPVSRWIVSRFRCRSHRRPPSPSGGCRKSLDTFSFREKTGMRIRKIRALAFRSPSIPPSPQPSPGGRGDFCDAFLREKTGMRGAEISRPCRVAPSPSGKRLG